MFTTATNDLVLVQTAIAADGVRLLRKPFLGDELPEVVGVALHPTRTYIIKV